MIKSGTIKKLLSAALAFVLVTTPAICVNATGDDGGEGTSNSTVTAEEAAAVPTTSSVTVDGKVVATTVSGAYLSNTIPGMAVKTGTAAISQGYALESGAKPYVRVYDISEKQSPAAYASINAVADSIGAKVIASVNLELGSILNSKFTLLSQDGTPINISFAIPKKALSAGSTYAIICVRPGGVFEVLPDLDDDPNTVTFDTTGGLGAYAIVVY